MKTMPSIYAYQDFRQFLVDWIERKRATASGFSARLFAKKAGFGAHDIFQLVSSGRRNLSMKSIAKFARALGLTGDESAYFEALVLMNQSDNPAERLQYYERLLGHVQRRKRAPLEKAQLAFFRSWLSPVIYEMMQFPDFQADPHWIAGRFSPPLSTVEVKHALASVLESGLAVEQDGRWRPVEQAVDTGDGVRDVHLHAYHEHALAKASDALNLPSAERYFQVTTVAASADVIDDFRRLAEKFEADALRLLEKHAGPPDEVFQISLQLFPILRSSRLSPKRPK